MGGTTFSGICAGTTKAGKRCRRVVIYANGFCKSHGGDSTDYDRERAKHLAKKWLRKHERWEKRIRAFEKRVGICRT